MPRWGFAMMTLVATAILLGGVSAASGNEPPLTDAGLDQTVDNGTTVYLDAGGSVDPDGTIASVQWTVTDPGGAPVATADDTSLRTSFTPTQTGVYTANLSVTDDAGATVEDTLYVTVEERDGPEVTLAGPGQTVQGEDTEFTVSTTAGDADLRRLHWIENGSVERTVALSGNESNVTVNRTFSEPGPLQLEATVLDTKGYAGTSSQEIRVISPSGGSTYDHCPGGGSPYFVEGEFIGCNDGGADMIFGDYVLEANNRDGLWLDNGAGGLVQMISESQLERMKDSSNDVLSRDEVQQQYEENLQNTVENYVTDFEDELHSQFNNPSNNKDRTASGGNNSNRNRQSSSNDRTISGRVSNTGNSCVAPCGEYRP